MDSSEHSRGDFWFYLLGVMCGIGAGLADVFINDLLFTALLVLSACIVLGMARRRAPWRWVVTVGVCIPLTELVAYKVQGIKASHGQVWGAWLAFLPGIAGAYGGAVLRAVIDNLAQKK